MLAVGVWTVGAERDSLVEVVRECYRPRSVLAVGNGSTDSQVPLLNNRGLVDGRATAYVCHGFECDLPTGDVDEVRELLNLNE